MMKCSMNGSKLASASAALLASTMLVAAPASADQIEGGIGLAGDFTAFDVEGGVQVDDLTNAGFIRTDDSTITADDTGTGGDLAVVGGETVDFYADYALDGSGLPIDPLWEISSNGTQFALELTDFTIEFQDENSIVLSGNATLTGTGFDPTPARWDSSLNQTGQGDFQVSTLSDTTATEVPVSGTLTLFGFGLVAAGVAMRRRLITA